MQNGLDRDTLEAVRETLFALRKAGRGQLPLSLETYRSEKSKEENIKELQPIFVEFLNSDPHESNPNIPAGKNYDKWMQEWIEQIKRLQKGEGIPAKELESLKWFVKKIAKTGENNIISDSDLPFKVHYPMGIMVTNKHAAMSTKSQFIDLDHEFDLYDFDSQIRKETGVSHDNRVYLPGSVDKLRETLLYKNDSFQNQEMRPLPDGIRMETVIFDSSSSLTKDEMNERMVIAGKKFGVTSLTAIAEDEENNFRFYRISLSADDFQKLRQQQVLDVAPIQKVLEDLDKSNDRWAKGDHNVNNETYAENIHKALLLVRRVGNGEFLSRDEAGYLKSAYKERVLLFQAASERIT